ncbi:MAG: GspH/FimT family pseudopilin [Planctomycetes bacterium]|nr:GspH/FimT family pseudopilin [Planctomycetota bacterium]
MNALRKHDGPCRIGLSLSGAMRPPACGAVRRRREAFTLVELILALALVLFLGAMIAVNYAGLRASQDLDEAADQFETAVRLAQAEASATGKRLRLEFDPAGGTCRLLIELLPLTEPNVFQEYSGCTWRQYLPGESSSVAASTFTGPSAFQTVTFGQQSTSNTTGVPAGQTADQQGQSFSPITFSPDGSCDSATVELVSRSPQDQRRAIIEIDGLNGTINSMILAPAELEEYRQQQGAGQ